MGLKLELDSLEGLDEALAALYTKSTDGKYKLPVDGLPDINGLTSALKAEREQREVAQRAIREFDGVDPGEIKKLMAQFQDEEEKKLIADGKLDAVFNKRTDKLKQDYQRKLKAAEETAASERTKAQKWNSRVLDNQVREAATKVDLYPFAVEDALLRGRNLFQLDDDGNAVQIRDGKTVIGKDGSTPYGPIEWLESDAMKEAAPHWYKALNGGSGAQSSSKTTPLQQGTIRADDAQAFGRNLEAIAKGTVTVIP